MIIQIGTEVDESRILWKHKESDEWERADIDDLIEAYENRQKEPKPGDLISRQALIDEVLDDGNGAVLSYPAGMYEDDLVERIEKQMIQHFIGVIEYAPPVEPKQSELHIDEPRGYTLKTDKAEVYSSKRPKRTETMMIDGEPTEIDPLSYEVGYTHGQSEQPKGKWIDTDSQEFLKVEECSVCGHESIERGNFCRYCGADMRGEK